VEGRDIYSGKVDVIVADGFVGNVALKTSGRRGQPGARHSEETLKATITRQVGYLLSRGACRFQKAPRPYGIRRRAAARRARRVLHHAWVVEYEDAIKNALRVAAEFAERNISDKIAKEVAGLRPSVPMST
jgi:glycerol-3-phosphate acyltransferase PlsX